MESRKTKRGGSLLRVLAVIGVLAIAAGLLLPKILERTRGQERWEFVLKWGSIGGGDGEFMVATGIAVDSRGNMFVIDTRNYRIQKFDSEGNFLAKWSSKGSGPGQFQLPMCVAVDSSGNVYVTDYRDHRIQKFDSQGRFLGKWGSAGSGGGQFSARSTGGPQHIAVDSEGNVLVVDSLNFRIQKFDSSGRFVTKWGSEGHGDGVFRQIPWIAVDSSGNVFLTDSINHRIQKFDSSGRFLTEWGSKGSGDGQFGSPHGVAVDSSGNLFVADSGNSRIQKFRRSR